MATLTLDQADRIIAAILERGAALDCRPLAVIVVEPGCKVKDQEGRRQLHDPF